MKAHSAAEFFRLFFGFFAATAQSNQKDRSSGTTDCGLGIKHGLGIKCGLENTDWV